MIVVFDVTSIVIVKRIIEKLPRSQSFIKIIKSTKKMNKDPIGTR